MGDGDARGKSIDGKVRDGGGDIQNLVAGERITGADLLLL